MGKSEKDKELLKNLDRVLKNGETDISESGDTDTRTALEFVRKAVSMGEAPSKEFTENLKAQLVHRLAEQEKHEASDDYDLAYWGVSRRKRWQGTLASIILFIIVAVILVLVFFLNNQG